MIEVIRLLAGSRPRDGEEGQGLAEYALILAIIDIVAIISLVFLGDAIGDTLSMIGDTIDDATS